MSSGASPDGRTKTMHRPPAVPRRPRKTPIRALFGLMGFAVSFGTVPAHAGPPSGTPIDNVAFASARDSTGAPLRFESDTVRVVVQPSPALAIDSGRRIGA